ncbi:MAG TPA: MFS transporter [Streptomyces sp.]|uniref:MFS transporter n=1 Tax=Streptomyces sp. TaxID=1931 RepID=UPI002D25237D|nr:MFS transporter [Streptomyces sp.]HZG04301.1 MFS transporter [Streptomyces sp.]
MTSVTPPPAGRREWIGLAVLALPILLISMDMTVLYLALPHLSADLRPSSTEVLWIMDAYGFLIAGALIPMGALGDRTGRRRILLIGATMFCAASVLAAYSTSPAMLIAARAALGIAGATVMPSALSLVRAMFHQPSQRGFAVAVVMTSFSVGTTIGPLLGGLLLEHFWWGSVFLLGIPVMVPLLVLGPMLLPEYRSPGSGRLDVLSAAMSLSSVLAVVYAVKHVASGGFDLTAAASAVAGGAIGIAFVRRQQRLADPLIDVGLLRNRAFSISLTTILLGLIAMGGTQFFISLFLQDVAGLSPLNAGLWMVPAMVSTIIGSMAAPVLTRRFHPAPVIGASLSLAAVGFAMLVWNGPDDLWLLLAGYVVIALGLSPMITLCTDLVISTAPAERAGAASAMSETAGEMGVALGVAILGSVGTAVYRLQVSDRLPEGLPPDAEAAARNTVSAARAAAEDLADPLGSELLSAVREAFSHGLNVTAALAAVLVAVAAARAALRLRSLPAPADEAGGDRTPEAEETA